jgi:hypothetical protein
MEIMALLFCKIYLVCVLKKYKKVLAPKYLCCEVPGFQVWLAATDLTAASVAVTATSADMAALRAAVSRSSPLSLTRSAAECPGP